MMASKSNNDDNSDESGFLSNLLKRLHLKQDKQEKPKILDSADLEGIVNYITIGKCGKIVTMAGAGISTSAGIPDFRSPKSGLYDNLSKYNLPSPQAIFEIDYFRENPEPFFSLAKELFPGNFVPTTSHCFIKLLHEKGLLLRHYTQNIDTLEHIAGIPEDKVIEAHGTFRTSHCMGCKEMYSFEWMKDKVLSEVIPRCTECDDIVKPDIVFFGENLPEKFFSNIDDDLANCDLLIILGTSLAVQPFASLVHRVSDVCPRLLINREKVGHQSSYLNTLLGIGNLEFDEPDNFRDVALLGDCDNVCKLLASALNWKDELKAIERSLCTNSKDPKSSDEHEKEDGLHKILEQ